MINKEDKNAKQENVDEVENNQEANKSNTYKFLGSLEPESDDDKDEQYSEPEGDQEYEEYDVEEYRSHNNPNTLDNDNDNDNDSDAKYSFPKVHPVEKYEIIPTITKVWEICLDNDTSFYKLISI